jgi:hypothetical protein
MDGWMDGWMDGLNGKQRTVVIIPIRLPATGLHAATSLHATSGAVCATGLQPLYQLGTASVDAHAIAVVGEMAVHRMCTM